MERLSAETGMAVEVRDDMVVLEDDSGRERLILEQGRRDGALYAIAPIGRFLAPEVAAPAHLMLLQLNADTDEFAEARIAADLDREIYVLMQRIPALGEDAHARSICDALLEQAESLAAALRGVEEADGRDALPEAEPAVRV